VRSLSASLLKFRQIASWTYPVSRRNTYAAFDRGVCIRSQCHFLSTTQTGQTRVSPMTSPFLHTRHAQSELIQGRTRSVENSNPLPRLTTQKSRSPKANKLAIKESASESSSLTIFIFSIFHYQLIRVAQ
jgi:hypothetical protein